MLLKLGLSLFILPLLVLMGAWGLEYADVSSCIYEGGSYDYILKECLMDQQGIFITFAERHPVLVNTSLWTSCAGLMFTLIGLYKGRS